MRADVATPHKGMVCNDFVDAALRTTAWEITFRLEGGDRWSYQETTTLLVAGRDEPFEHRDANTLVRVGPALPNPMLLESEPA